MSQAPGPGPHIDRHPASIVLDLVLPVVAVFAALLGLAAGTRTGGAGQPGQEWLIAPALGLLLLARRRAPVAVLLLSCLLYLVVAWFDGSLVRPELPLAAAFFSTAQLGRLRWALGTAVALLVATFAIRMRQASQDFFDYLGLDLLTTVIVLVGAIAAGDAIRTRGRLRWDRAKFEARLAEDDEDDEANDNDEGQDASGGSDRHGRARPVPRGRSQEAAAFALALHRPSEEELSPAADLETPGGTGEVKDARSEARADVERRAALLDRCRAAGLTVSVVEDPPDGRATDLARWLRLGLTHALRPGTCNVQVRLARTPDRQVLVLRDDGPAATGWLAEEALERLAARLDRVGGVVTREVDPGGDGTRLRISVPWPQEQTPVRQAGPAAPATDDEDREAAS